MFLKPKVVFPYRAFSPGKIGIGMFLIIFITGLLLFYSGNNIAISPIIRIGGFIVITLMLISQPSFLPFVITFIIIGQRRTPGTFGYFPSEIWLYVLLIVVIFLLKIKLDIRSIRIKTYAIFMFYSGFIEIIALNYNFDMLSSQVLGLLLIFFLRDKETHITFRKLIAYLFVFLSYSVLMNYDSLYFSLGGANVFRDRNYFSAIMSIGSVIAFYNTMIQKRKGLWLTLLILFLSVQVIVLSRNGMISTGIACIFISLFSGSAKKILISVSILSVISILLISFNYSEGMIERFQKRDVETGGTRVQIWDETFLKFIEQNPLRIVFGYGYYSFIDLSNGRSIHNNYLEFLYSYGLVGLFFFLCMFYFAFKKTELLYKAILISMGITMISLTPFMYTDFWLILSFCIAAPKIEIKNESKNKYYGMVPASLRWRISAHQKIS